MYWGERMLDVAARARCWTCGRAEQVRRRGAEATDEASEATDEASRQRRCANAADPGAGAAAGSVRLVRGEGRDVPGWYGVRDAACPLSTRGGGGGGGGGQGGTWPSTVSMRAVCARKGGAASARGPRPGTALPRERERGRERVTRPGGAAQTCSRSSTSTSASNASIDAFNCTSTCAQNTRRQRRAVRGGRRPPSRRRDGWQGPPCRADGCAWSLVPGVHGCACTAGGRIGTTPPHPHPPLVLSGHAASLTPYQPGTSRPSHRHRTCLSSSVTAPPSCEAFL